MVDPNNEVEIEEEDDEENGDYELMTVQAHISIAKSNDLATLISKWENRAKGSWSGYEAVIWHKGETCVYDTEEIKRMEAEDREDEARYAADEEK